jgi:hypothetical protein
LVDFTGSSGRLHVRSKYGATDTPIELTTENGGIEFGDDGSISAQHVGNRHRDLTFNRGVYDLEIVPPSGEPYKIIKGNVSSTRGDAMSRNKVVVEESVVRVVTVGIQGPPGSVSRRPTSTMATRPRANASHRNSDLLNHFRFQPRC